MSSRCGADKRAWCWAKTASAESCSPGKPPPLCRLSNLCTAAEHELMRSVLSAVGREGRGCGAHQERREKGRGKPARLYHTMAREAWIQEQPTTASIRVE